ncbi:hypothetical protein [Paraburkholderia bengalensis]|uniref:hypothetical protein n=1 Tax=Paraburkholderia bengalensis TaxID=2747562 RepID=UPI0030141E05
MGSNSALDASLAEVNSAFDLMLDSYNVSCPDSPQSVEALRRYELAKVVWQAEYESAIEDGRLSGIDNLGLGRRLLVLHGDREPISQYVYVLSVVHGFAATCQPYSNVISALADARPHLVFTDADCHVKAKAAAIRLIKAHSRGCKVAVLSIRPPPAADEMSADLVIRGPASVTQILEELCKLVDLPDLSAA